MRVDLGSIDVNEYARRMIACRLGDHGRLASREDVRIHSQGVGYATDDDLAEEYDRCEECHPDLVGEDDE